MNIDSRQILRKFSVPMTSCSLFSFVSDSPFGKIRFWSLEGRYQSIVFVFCQRGGLLFELLDVSQRVMVTRK